MSTGRVPLPLCRPELWSMEVGARSRMQGQSSSAFPLRTPQSLSSHISSLPSITTLPLCRSTTMAVTRLWLRWRKMRHLSMADRGTFKNMRQINEVREISVHKSKGIKSLCGCSYSEAKQSECCSLTFLSWVHFPTGCWHHLQPLCLHPTLWLTHLTVP